MRYRFAREGITTVLDVHFEPGSLRWEEDKIPVTWQAGMQIGDLLGTASDLQREDDGWLTAEFTWNDNEKSVNLDAILDKDVFMTVFCNEIVEQDRRISGRVRRVSSARLRHIFATIGNPWIEK